MMKIICVVFCFVYFLSAVTGNESRDNRRIVRECMKEVGVDRSYVKRFRNGDFSVRDEKAKCFTKCFALKKKIVNEKQEFDQAALLPFVVYVVEDEKKAKIMIENCQEFEKGKDLCEYCFNAFECLWIEMKKLDTAKSRNIFIADI